MTQTIKSTIDISPKNDFTDGLSFSTKILSGQGNNDFKSTLPESFSTNPISFYIELTIDDAEKGSLIVGTLEGVKEMLAGMIPGVNEMLSQGINVSFRHVANSVFIDVSLEGGLGEMAKQQLSKFSLDLTSQTDSGETRLVSGLKLNAPLETSYEDFVKMATQFKVTGSGDTPISSLLNSLNTIIDTLVPTKSKQLKTFIKIAKCFACFNKLDYVCKYDSDLMSNYVLDLAGRFAHTEMGGASYDEANPELGTQILGSQLAQYQEMAKSQLEQGLKPMAEAFIGPYKEALNVLNFDKFSFAIVSPSYPISINISLGLVGLTEFLRNSLLN